MADDEWDEAKKWFASASDKFKGRLAKITDYFS